MFIPSKGTVPQELYQYLQMAQCLSSPEHPPESIVPTHNTATVQSVVAGQAYAIAKPNSRIPPEGAWGKPKNGESGQIFKAVRSSVTAVIFNFTTLHTMKNAL